MKRLLLLSDWLAEPSVERGHSCPPVREGSAGRQECRRSMGVVRGWERGHSCPPVVRAPVEREADRNVRAPRE